MVPPTLAEVLNLFRAHALPLGTEARPQELAADAERAGQLAQRAGRLYGDDVRPSSGDSVRWSTFVGERVVVRVCVSGQQSIYSDDPVAKAVDAAQAPNRVLSSNRDTRAFRCASPGQAWTGRPGGGRPK